MKIVVVVVFIGWMATSACEPRSSNEPNAEPSTFSLADTLLVVGQSDEQEGHALFQVRGAVRSSKGRLYVADGSSGEIRGFDSNGVLVATYGGAGAGPGEHRGLAGLWIAQADTLVSHDGATGRLIYWSPDGTPEREERISVFDQGVGGFVPGSSRYIKLTLKRPHQFPAGTSHVDSLIISISGGEQEVELPAIGYQTRYAATLPTGGLIFTPLPLEPKASYAVGRKTIYAGEGGSWHIRRFTQTGEQLSPIEAAIPRRPLTAEIREAWQRLIIENMVPEQRSVMQSYLAALPYADSLPAFDAMIVDATDRLWVREFPAPGDSLATWRVYSDEGWQVGVMTLRVTEKLLQVGNDFVVIGDMRTDGAEMVTIRQLRRGG